MKKFTFFMLSIFLLIGTGFSQSENFEILESSECDQTINYAPSENTPVKTLRVAFHVVQHSSGYKSFQNTPEVKQFFENTIQKANQLLGNLHPLEPQGAPEITSPYIADSRIRLSLDTICFWVHDQVYNGFSMTGLVLDYARYLQEYYIIPNNQLNEEQKYNTLHLIVGGNWDTDGGHADPDNNMICFKGWYKFFEDGLLHGNHNNLLHELGHCCGLAHCNDFYGCDCGDLGAFPNNITNNIMALHPSATNAIYQ